jgi:hypothetical protein
LLWLRHFYYRLKTLKKCYVFERKFLKN